VLPVLRSGCLQAHGFTRVSLAGHPEGHPVVPAPTIWRAQVEKATYASAVGLQVSLVTQFFFEAAPYVAWARDLRAAGVAARLVAGLAGPASIAKLLALARHCGVGPSMRALTSRPGSAFRLLADRQPDALLRALAAVDWRPSALIDGVHLFCFGGFLRTARWLRQVAEEGGREGE
jgi:methylenetetrahydrofolate reductase (NADPH)